MINESRRALYRIVYPLTERPTIEVGQSLHDVIDCSERGIRYTLNHQRVPVVGSKLSGVLRLHSGKSRSVEGVVIRVSGGVGVVQLNTPLSFAEVMAEQRYLRLQGFLLKG